MIKNCYFTTESNCFKHTRSYDQPDPKCWTHQWLWSVRILWHFRQCWWPGSGMCQCRSSSRCVWPGSRLTGCGAEGRLVGSVSCYGANTMSLRPTTEMSGDKWKNREMFLVVLVVGSWKIVANSGAKSLICWLWKYNYTYFFTDLHWIFIIYH